jgi:hypothetical protein
MPGAKGMMLAVLFTLMVDKVHDTTPTRVEIMDRKPRRKEKKRNWKMKRQVMVKTRKQAACPRARKHPAEVDTV